jgi:beta-lactam-binding protein with PASTA domain
VPKGLGICEQEPAAGAEVRRGTTVRVVVARAC